MARHHNEPTVGNWYNSKGFPESFMVVDCDQDDFVEIQYLDGEIDKIDFEAWDTLHPIEVPEPEDAAAPYSIDHEDADILRLLNEIEDQHDLDEHLHHIDKDEETWD